MLVHGASILAVVLLIHLGLALAGALAPDPGTPAFYAVATAGPLAIGAGSWLISRSVVGGAAGLPRNWE